MKIKSWDDDIWSGASYKKGELVCLSPRAKSFSPKHRQMPAGIVVGYWPSNVYESASYEVLVEGDVKIIESKYLVRA